MQRQTNTRLLCGFVPFVAGLMITAGGGHASGAGLQVCQAGSAGGYPCQGIDLYAVVPLASMGGGTAANDIWGWTDPLTGKEYALVGRTTGTAFVDVSTPDEPIYVGDLPAHDLVASTWRDIKVYADHAFIVSEAAGHGMQVFDLTLLRGVVTPPVTFAESARYADFGGAHNVAINEASEFAYVAGPDGPPGCLEGLHMIDVTTPTSPTSAGCADNKAVHDAQCVTYDGPDAAHVGKEICFNSNGSDKKLSIIDVTNKLVPVSLASVSYAGADFPHQGWLTEDHSYFLLGDELDETNPSRNTRTYIWDVSDLDAPTVIGTHTSDLPAIDHNQYVRGRYTYQANYRAGLRILSLDDVASGNLSEVAFFDVHPADNSAAFNGAWSVYPYFASGTLVVSSLEMGLFVLRPQSCEIAGTCLFADGFETGSTSRWSAATP